MTLHEVVTETRHVSCACGASADQDCTCGHRGVHYARLAHARRAGYLDAGDFAQAIHDADVFTGLTVLLDPEEVAR
jgi:hypothetical protein